MRESLPPRTTQLASIAVFLTGRLLAALKGPERPFDVTAALLWNNLSERLQDAGFFPSALECARESVARLRRLTSQDSTHRAHLVVSLLTLSKRLTANQRHGEAIQVAEEAVRESGLLPTGNAQARNHHRARTALANRFAEAGQHQAAVEPALAACHALHALAQTGMNVKVDLAVASLACGNSMTQLGDYSGAKPFPARAHDLFRVLTGHSPDHYLEFYLAAANALAIDPARRGRRSGDLRCS